MAEIDYKLLRLTTFSFFSVAVGEGISVETFPSFQYKKLMDSWKGVSRYVSELSLGVYALNLASKRIIISITVKVEYAKGLGPLFEKFGTESYLGSELCHGVVLLSDRRC